MAAPRQIAAAQADAIGGMSPATAYADAGSGKDCICSQKQSATPLICRVMKLQKLPATPWVCRVMTLQK